MWFLQERKGSMKVRGVNNQTNFNGNVILMNNLEFAPKLKELLPKFKRKVKDKPYDVYINVRNVHVKSDRIKKTTVFNAMNCGYWKECQDSVETVIQTNKSKKQTYTNIFDNLIKQMDSKIENAKQKKEEKRPYKEVFKDILHDVIDILGLG